MWRSESNILSFHYVVWVWGIELRSSVLMESIFMYGNNLLVPIMFLQQTLRILMQCRLV